MSREGIPQFNWAGLSGMKQAQPPVPYISVRLKHLGHLGLKIPSTYIGGSMTWDELSSLILPWGNNETALYIEPEPGWTYTYDLGLHRFTVTDNSGQRVVYENIRTLSDLAISWSIFESPQFSIVINAYFENTAFLIGWRYKPGFPQDPNYPAEPVEDRRADYLGYAWAHIEEYLLSVFHLSCGRLLSWENGEGVQDGEVTLELTGYFRSVLLAAIRDLSASGNYPSNLTKNPKLYTGVKELVERQAQSYILGQLLMIHLFASISSASKPVFEPWMLWHIFQWLGRGTVTTTRDRTFDLSPWWG